MRYNSGPRWAVVAAMVALPASAAADAGDEPTRVAARDDLQAAAATAVAARTEAPAVVGRPQGQDSVLHPAQPRDPRPDLVVHARFGHAMADGCDYNAAVDGRVRRAVLVTNRRDGAPRYRPDLTVTSSVRCPGRAAARTVRRHVTGASLTRDRLESAVELAAKLDDAGEGGQVCRYTPDVTFYTDGRVRGERMERSCTVARGGGPARHRR